jgi:hypothetical protein
MTKKAQMKVQEMAFVLVAIVIFFIMVTLVYLAIRMSSLKEDVTSQREEAAKELARKLADIPEFSWTASGCSGCLDMDKLIVLKDRTSYRNFWDIDYLMIENVYPNKTDIECTKANYPDCRTITIVNNSKYIGSPASAFVALCRLESSEGGYSKCELGKIHVGSKAIT